MCQPSDGTHRTIRGLMVVLTLALLLSAMWLPGTHAQTSEPITPASELASEPSPTSEPALAAPTATDEPMAAPTATDVPIAAPTATDVPTAAAQTATALATAEPTATDVATSTPTVSTAASPTANATATSTTTDEPAVSLRVNEANTQFGQVSASGDLDPTISDLTSTVDPGGAFYVRTSAIELTVTASGPWSGACFAGSDYGMLDWRFTGTTTWAPFAVAGADGPIGSSCFPPGAAGQHTFTYDLRLRVEPGHPAGLFVARIVFDVEG